MKSFYYGFLGFIVFYFIAFIFGSLVTFNPAGDFSPVFVSAILFGFLTAFLPTILGFFKIKEGTGPIFLGALVVTFVFFLVGELILLLKINSGATVSFFHRSLAITVQSQVLAYVLISLFSSAIIVALYSLSKKK